MIEICILSENQIFAEDLAQQIEKYVSDCTVIVNEVHNKSIVFVDENESLLKKVIKEEKAQYFVLLSKDKEIDEYADVVIRKPIVLKDLLDSLKNKTLLPKVNRRECIKFKEYSLFPIKKEITSSVFNKTIKLTEREVDILKYLYQNSDTISTKENLLENVWGYSADVTTHTIETHIYRLRQKVEEDGGSQLIITENNGYRLNI